jgi:hypothetical protein
MSPGVIEPIKPVVARRRPIRLGGNRGEIGGEFLARMRQPVEPSRLQ